MEPAPIEQVADPVARFFAYARERHAVYLRRQAGQGWPWTLDPVLRDYRFTNVFRELDRVTVWFRRNIRARLAAEAEVLLATVLFRWFNRETTGETLFLQTDIGWEGRTAFEEYVRCGDLHVLRAALLTQHPPYVTGAYTINTNGAPRGLTKQEGVLRQFETFARRPHPHAWRTRAEQMMTPRFNHSIEGTTRWLQEGVPCMGPFMAYEVASDLRWTSLLDQAPDILTWANPGPGAQRGTRRCWGAVEAADVRRAVDEDAAVPFMRQLLTMASNTDLWPRHWPAWEMREVEHTLCEFDKYERTRLGQGRPRSVFRNRQP
jgi:hypothetical protein